MRPSAHIAAVIDLLAQWQEVPGVPFRDILASYGRQRRYIGSGDRRRITDLAYTALRYGERCAFLLGAPMLTMPPRLWAILSLVLSGSAEPEARAAFDGSGYGPPPLTPDEESILQRALNLPRIFPAATAHECPAWAWAALEAVYGTETGALLDSLNALAPVDFRVNTLKTDRKTVLARLKKEDIAAAPTPYSPLGIRFAHGTDLRQHPLYREGDMEPQDESSQLAAQLMTPKPGDTVLDFCAGAGGKTLALAALMANKGRLVVHDTAPDRLNAMLSRLDRAGVRVAMNAPPLLPEKTFDSILVDAPCSGSGTWRRTPEARWRYGAEDIAAFAAQQEALLAEAAPLVRPGGVLVYATCSVFTAENEAVAEAFSAAHADFTAEAPVGFPLPGTPWYRLTPQHHGTDGFFVARWRRASL